MCQCITITSDVHLDARDASMKCLTLATSEGRPFPVLRVGPVAFYPSRDQLRLIRDAIVDYLCESDEVPADDPSWDSAIDALPTMGVIRPRCSFAAVEIGPADILPALEDMTLIPDAPDFHVTQRAGYWESLTDNGTNGITRLPTIAGGSPDAEPYEPTEADLAELGRWLHDVDSDPMAFPEKADSLADRRRWQHQNNLSEQSFAARAE